VKPLIVLEGIDGSGKSTQLNKLKETFDKSNIKYHVLDFPNYTTAAGSICRDYLDGKFGTDIGDVNPYAASMFFAVDRMVSYLSDWKSIDRISTVILSDRYYTSNMVHQGAKLPPGERMGFFNWIDIVERSRMGLPEPSLVIYLNMEPEKAYELMKSSGDHKRGIDLHESDLEYLTSVYSTAILAADRMRWETVDCIHRDRKLKTINEIHDEIVKIIDMKFGLFRTTD
jgi:dTMP kinase